ncbi:MAG: hypothetical protein JWO22_3030 [Frankiales bacterium]|nr:hypothetical protein [Frankiales bacterium]
MTARRPALDRATAMRLAATENDRFLAQLRRLGAEDWSKPTDCQGWRVRDLVGHVVGMTEMSASMIEQGKQMTAARRAGGEFIDALTAVQVANHATDSTEELVERFAVIGPRSVKGRRRTPGFVRGRTLPIPQTVGAQTEDWTIGFLVDVVLSRDPWMHRIDLARATGQDLELTPEHDGVVVNDVVTEWAERHGQPCTVELDGPAGGRWQFAGGGPTVTDDAIDFCRGLSGRGEPALATAVPF